MKLNEGLRTELRINFYFEEGYVKIIIIQSLFFIQINVNV